MKRLFLLLLTVCATTTVTLAQKRTIDSIQIIIKNDKEDTNKIVHLNYLASLYSQTKKYKDAERQLLSSLSLAEKMGSLTLIKTTNYNLSELYKKLNQPTKELGYYKKYISIRDSISNQAKRTTALLQLETIQKEAKASSEKSQSIGFGTIAGGALLLFLCILLTVKLLKANKENRQLVDGQKPLEISNAELTKKKTALEESSSQQSQEIEKQKSLLKKYSPIINVDEEFSKKKTEFSQLLEEYENNLAKQKVLQQDLNLLEENLETISYGLYKPHYNFGTSDEFKIKLDEIYEKEKEMIRNEKATKSPDGWTVNGSLTEGKKMIKHYSKLMLRAFNGECDSATARVSWNNIGTTEARIVKSCEAINNLASVEGITITKAYEDLKLQELRLEFELQEKIHQEKEEQRKIKEHMREEAKVQEEMEKAQRDAELEETRYQRALEKAKAEISTKTGVQLGELQEKIKSLEENLQKAQEQKARAISRAQQTKSGYVYIVSNIGAFGENVYKFGMTRRLEPQDRIDELGNASVPFDFDVHGLIYTENAPELENKLHKHLNDKRINLVHMRREFFNVTMDEIEQIVKELNLNMQLTKIAEAKEYRMTQSIREAKKEQIRTTNTSSVL